MQECVADLCQADQPLLFQYMALDHRLVLDRGDFRGAPAGQTQGRLDGEALWADRDCSIPELNVHAGGEGAAQDEEKQCCQSKERKYSRGSPKQRALGNVPLLDADSIRSDLAPP